MSELKIMSGLEMFEQIMDTEAEATVSIKSGDDSDDSSMAPEAAETIAEDNVATDEKTDDDVDTAINNVEQTEKAMSYAVNEYLAAYNAYNVSKRYGASTGFLAYLNQTSSFASCASRMGKEVPSVEAFNASNDTHSGLIVAAAEANMKDAFESIKKFFVKLKEFFIQLGKTILSKIVGQKKRLTQLKEQFTKIDVSAYKRIPEIAEVEVVSLANLQKVFADIQNLSKLDFDKLAEKANAVNEIEGYLNTKTTIGKLQFGAKDLIKMFDQAIASLDENGTKNKIQGAINNIDEAIKNSNSNPQNAKNEQVELNKKRVVLMKFLACINKANNALVYIGNLAIRAYKLSSANQNAPAKEAFNINLTIKQFDKFVASEESYVPALEADDSSSSFMDKAKSVASKTGEAIKQFFVRMKKFFMSLWDKFIAFVRSKFTNLKQLKERLSKVDKKSVTYGSKFDDVKVMNPKYVEPLLKEAIAVTDKFSDNVRKFSVGGFFKNIGESYDKLTGANHSGDKAVGMGSELWKYLVSATSDETKVSINSRAADSYANKSTVVSIVDKAIGVEKAVPKYESLRKSLITMLEDADKHIKELEGDDSMSAHDKQLLHDRNYDKHKKAVAARKVILAMSRQCSAIISNVSKLIVGAGQIASSFLRAATASSEESK